MHRLVSGSVDCARAMTALDVRSALTLSWRGRLRTRALRLADARNISARAVSAALSAGSSAGTETRGRSATERGALARRDTLAVESTVLQAGFRDCAEFGTSGGGCFVR